MRRLISLVLCCVMLCSLSVMAAEPPQARWSQETGDGQFLTVRIPFDNGGEPVQWTLSRHLLARYADTKEVVALSAYYDGAVFATVPAEEGDRALEVFVAAPSRFADLVVSWNGNDYYNPPSGTDEMAIRGVVQGDEAGRLQPDKTLTRAEVVVMLTRALGLTGQARQPADIHYADVAADAWYAGAVKAARAYGILTAGDCFYPERPVSREELITMTYRAFRGLGWIHEDAGQVEGPPAAWDTDYQDAGKISGYAVGSYAVMEQLQLLLATWTAEGEEELDGRAAFLEPQRSVTRGECVGYLYSAMRFLPVYPSQLAIEYGFDRQMPVLDGSTSTYAYTRAVFGALFQNYDNHSAYPDSHSKSAASYERLIAGQADLLFAATKPTAELERQALAAGVELEYIPIAYDAMVFFTNEENSISGLTSKQIQDIYVNNAYSNWNQVGGPDAVLLPFSRNTDSGSHALMEQYFLEDGALSLHPAILQGNISQAMSTALSDVAAALQTDPPAYALGYSVYYYYQVAQDIMGDVTANKLRLLPIDGVLPTDETIADGRYPLSGYNYLVLRKDTPQDAPARRMAEFMRSEAGQTCVESAGFGPLR